MVWDRTSSTVAAVATNSSAGVRIGALGIDLLCAALEASPPAPDPWAQGEPVPAELDGVLGRWWSEGAEFVFRFRSGRLEALAEGDTVPAVFARESEGVYRVAAGRERGELLRIERGAGGRVERLVWATYPFTREPRAF